MIRRIFFAMAAAALLSLTAARDAHAQQAYGRAWGNSYNTTD